MLVVWEPILPTDWRAPSESTLARLADKRARQFWDPQHLVATALNRFAKQNSNQPRPMCCVHKGFDWDQAILYSPRELWEQTPVSVYWNGPIVRTIPGLEQVLRLPN